MTNEALLQARRQKSKRDRKRYKLHGPVVHRTEKRCCACKQVKPIEQFALCKTNADWHATSCKPCAVERSRQWRNKNPERARAHSYAQFQKERVKPKGERFKYNRAWYLRNKEKAHAATRKWGAANLEKKRRGNLISLRKRLANDPAFALLFKIRTRVRLILKGLRKSASTERLLGCTAAECRKYLEMHFEPWMSWDNYGRGEGRWEIDHVVPVSAFDLSDPDQQKLCFHYTNLRPLCSKKNREKWYHYDPAALNKLKETI